MKKFIYLIPRIITGLICLFLLLVIVGNLYAGQTRLMALVLAGVFAVFLYVTLLAWRKPKPGGIILVVIGVISILMMLFAGSAPDVKPVLILGLPIIVSGIMFLVEEKILNGRIKARSRAN